MIGEAIQHPKHYQHPSGVECIEIIRHHVFDIGNAIKYSWRAGLKSEEGMSLSEKEAEDCGKALWYLHDYLDRMALKSGRYPSPPFHPSGIDCEVVAKCYSEEIAQAFRCLWFVGVIINGRVYSVADEKARVERAIESIESRLERIRTGKGTCGEAI